MENNLTYSFAAKRILVVDDVPDNIFLLQVILSESGYQTYSADSGKSTLAIVESYPPDLILLDFMMPDMDGIEVARRIKRNQLTQHIPVILVTACNIMDISDEEKQWIDGILEKPIDFDEVFSLLNLIFKTPATT